MLFALPACSAFSPGYALPPAHQTTQSPRVASASITLLYQGSWRRQSTSYQTLLFGFDVTPRDLDMAFVSRAGASYFMTKVAALTDFPKRRHLMQHVSLLAP